MNMSFMLAAAKWMCFEFIKGGSMTHDNCLDSSCDLREKTTRHFLRRGASGPLNLKRPFFPFAPQLCTITGSTTSAMSIDSYWIIPFSKEMDYAVLPCFLHCSISFHVCCRFVFAFWFWNKVVTKDDATTSTFTGLNAQKCWSSEFLVEIADLSDSNAI